ncbi:MAG TPA: WD40 repeat domain-containing protein [Gemmataceae bacterium]|nr:WD40 repeat domain-containing protein [Gemmataceae bacterium]
MEPTTHVVTVLPRKPGPRAEPIAPNLVASLVHPDRTAINWQARFSPRGDRLFTVGGAPSPVVQVWDVASGKEIRRIETLLPRMSQVRLTPDWKALYVPVRNIEVKTVEQGGKKRHQLQFSGQIRIWDLASGKEREPLPLEAGWAPAYGEIDPTGRYLVCTEQGQQARRMVKTVVWELATSKKTLLCQDYALEALFPYGQVLVVGQGSGVLKLLQLSTGKELAKARCPDSNIGAVAPDGSVFAVSRWGKSTLEVLFLDGKTLQERGKLVGKGNANGRPWMGGRFTPDGKRFVIVDKVGNVLAWDVAGQKLERTLCTLDNPQPPDTRTSWCRQALAFSPDSKTVAVGWSPKWDEGVGIEMAPDPQDVPQPRVSLIPLDGSAPARVLVAPHGYVGSLAFSPDGRMLAFGGTGAVHLFDLSR